jgi:hypothetical protein
MKLSSWSEFIPLLVISTGNWSTGEKLSLYVHRLIRL